MKAAVIPTIFDGEIICQIEWEDQGNKGNAQIINEAHTGTKYV